MTAWTRHGVSASDGNHTITLSGMKSAVKTGPQPVKIPGAMRPRTCYFGTDRLRN
jgi:hypothetical protein